jgi:hypothetical protein
MDIVGAAVASAQTAPPSLYALGVQDTGSKNVTFDCLKVNGSTGCGGAPPMPTR